MSEDFVFRGTVAELDPQLHELLERERIRQEKTIVLIASESEAPEAVEEAMGSKFGNIYAEGYPRENSRRQTEEDILDFENELALYRRNSDPRYYKGVEYADVVEALCRRRAADLFAANGVKPEDMYVNVQPLSGGPANSALYTAIIKPGDTIMGLKLSDGGHLSHGAPVNRSGTIFNSVSYVVDPETEQLDYEEIREMALEVKPAVIVAGFSAYPRIINWDAFKAIADEVGAHFHADIAHISGLVAAGHHPSPIGIADSVMTTTHKSLCGPRGAMLMTHRKDIGLKIDKAVFPGEQGGAHFNTIGALALALKLAQTDQFVALQDRIMRNATRLANKLADQGLRIVGGGSENHLLLVDVTGTKNHYGLSLEGDSAARILDVAGIVTNRNTIPGDRSAFIPSGLRLGTVWISQRGFGDAEIDKLAEAIGTIVSNAVPLEYGGPIRKRTRRTKVSREALQKARSLVHELTKQPDEVADPSAVALRVRGSATGAFLGQALGSDVASLGDGESQASGLIIDGETTAVTVQRESADVYWLRFADGTTAATAKLFLQDLSDGYILIGNDAYGKLAGPVVVENGGNSELDAPIASSIVDSKPFFVGMSGSGGEALPEFDFDAISNIQAGSAISDALAKAGAVFSADGVVAHYGDADVEFSAINNGAALIDQSTKSVFVASGPHARDFVDAVYTNEVARLKVGGSNLGFLLMPNGTVLDMVTVTRTDEDSYVIIGNDESAAKVGKWLTAVDAGSILIDPNNPGAKVAPCGCYEASAAYASAADGKANWVMLSLQGPKAGEMLEQAGVADYAHAGGNVGRKDGFELMVPAGDATTVWEALVTAGATPTGYDAVDRARTIAGIAAMGAEVGGEIDPNSACYGNSVKLWKPFFVGRSAYIQAFESPTNTIVRFSMTNAEGVPSVGSTVFDSDKAVGSVTSIAMNGDGSSLTGMAHVPLKYRRKGSKLSVDVNGKAVASPTVGRFGK